MEFNNMRVKTILSHSSSIIHIGFFKDNDKEHFYSLSNNGQLKEWLLNLDGSILLLETTYLLRPGNEYLDFIGYPPTENSNNGHNIIISAINVSDDLIFCGYEDGLVLVWRQERRNVVDDNIIKSWKRSRTIVNKKIHIMNEISQIELTQEKKEKSNQSNNDDIEEDENEDKENDENDINSEQNNNKSNINNSNEKSLDKNNNNDLNNNKINNNNKNDLYRIDSMNINKSLLYEGPTLCKKFSDFINSDTIKQAHKENLIREGKFRIDDITLFSTQDDLKYYKSSMVEEFVKKKNEVVIGENDFKYKYKSYTNIFWLKYLFINQTQEISYLFYYNNKDIHILLSSSKDGTICCYNIDNGELIYTFNIPDFIKYACFCKEITKSRKVIPKTHITLLCNTPHKIYLNLSKEKPINMNMYDFKYNDFTKVVYLNNYFYLLGKRGTCVVFNNNFEDDKIVFYHKPIPIYDIIQFEKNFVIFTSENNMVLVEFNFDLNKMIDLFYIKLGMSRVTNLIYINDILYVTNADKNIYSIDVKMENELYYERSLIKKEEEFCNVFNVFYEAHKNKRKKKKKGKKGKGKSGVKTSSSNNKKKTSPTKKKK